MGTSYGGFYYPKEMEGLDENSIIYCVGAGEDITHDISIAKKLGSNVYIFDPTPRAIEHVNLIKDVYNGKKEKIISPNFGGGEEKYWDIIMENKIEAEKIIFKPYALHTEDGNIKFYEPSNKNYVSHSVVRLMKSDDYIEVESKKLTSIMKEFNHVKIDLLKIDIEGNECEVLEDMLKNKIYPKYLSIDFDLGWHGERIQDRRKCVIMKEQLLDNGYELINSMGSDYSFKLKNI
jgi:FkbM family methyltransferase